MDSFHAHLVSTMLARCITVEKTVYLLGAGFSAPLGLPVMSNFMALAEDMFISKPERFKYFKEVFQLAGDLARVKSFLHSDQLNIEEIFSILEMKRDLAGEESRDLFARFLCDVIEYYTPDWTCKSNETNRSQLHKLMWSMGDHSIKYGVFIAGLFGIELNFSGNFQRGTFGAGKSLYAVVSLNYDRVLEILCENASTYLNDSPNLSFRSAAEASKGEPFENRPALLKLHGDVKAGDVVPPTWSKGIHEPIEEQWRQAYRVLREATRIRILGYSLPVSDAPVRFLLKAALADGRYLKEIDVLCRDTYGEVRERYETMISFPAFRFVSAETELYLENVLDKAHLVTPMIENKVRSLCRRFNESHESFFKSNS